MKKLFKLFLASLFLIVACLIPSSAFAQSHHTTQPARPMSTIPYCYGDGWGSYQPCDGKPSQNGTNCPHQVDVNSKAIGSQSQGQIGHLDTWYTENTKAGTPYGCNAWWAILTITHSGCYTILSLWQHEDGSGGDGSLNGYQTDTPLTLCGGHSLTTLLVGDWQPGGCYFASSQVSAGTEQDTSTIESCY